MSSGIVVLYSRFGLSLDRGGPSIVRRVGVSTDGVLGKEVEEGGVDGGFGDRLLLVWRGRERERFFLGDGLDEGRDFGFIAEVGDGGGAEVADEGDVVQEVGVGEDGFGSLVGVASVLYGM